MKMVMDNESKGKLMYELSYLYTEWGDELNEEEADLIKDCVKVATNEGLEHIGDIVWPVLYKIYRKYENKNLEGDVPEDTLA
jgi:Na+/phosphate symporter